MLCIMQPQNIGFGRIQQFLFDGIARCIVNINDNKIG